MTPIPSLSHKRSVSCREAEGLVTELWPPRFVTAALATVGWKRGCQPFSCRCSQNVTHCRKERATYLFKASIPATPFGNYNHKLPPRSRFLRATVHSALWLHDVHPFVEAQKICLMQRSRGSCHGFVVSKICYNEVIVLSVVLWDCCKPMNRCRD